MASTPTHKKLSHKDQLFAIGMVGILAFTVFFAMFLLPIIQNSRAGNTNSPQTVTISGYVLIGNKGSPTYIYFDNPTTGRITGLAYYSDKSYTTSLISGYYYTVTVSYVPSGSQSGTCTPNPSSVSTVGASSTSPIRQDFSC